MLKALEMVGFKSFADRTRFDFPDGITVVVGPNGSGKSNIVDAMKWVLGSQSAKSLRGKDMSDVIFKGSQTRGPAGAAEATIIFDNSSGTLPIDAPEVHVTRRVYRSGEGEYLINQQAVRLKDVKALIRGTGIGIDAYSLIEQGKVDRMLQANAKDRRAIFEEAAGISRFKAKKVEAERRLARVQTNLTRLGDIVDEVAGRLKTLKGQASKAERYRQAAERMKQLRTQLAWTDWAELTSQVVKTETDLAAAKKQQEAAQAERELVERDRQSAELELQQIAELARESERRRAEWAGETAKIGGRREADEVSRVELRMGLASQLRRLRTMRRESGSAQADLQTAIDQADEAITQLKRVTAGKDAATARRDELQRSVQSIEQQRNELQQSHLALVRRVADHEAGRGRVAQQIREATRAGEEAVRLLAAAQTNLQKAESEVVAATAVVDELNVAIAEATKQIEIADSKVATSRRLLQRRRDEVGSLKIRLQGITERARVLDELQKRQEGVGSGVREVLRLPEGVLRKELVGIVADCFNVDRQVAPLIDAALGQRSQYIIVRGGAIGDAIIAGKLKIESRVGIIRLDELPTRRPGDRIRLDGLHGVIGRADKMVDCDEDLQALCRHLLGNTWLVDSLQTALGLRKLSGAGLRFVTAAGELLDNDGSSVVGPPGGDSGLVSRRSELAAAKSEIDHYAYQIAEADQEATRLAAEVEEQAATLGRHEQVQRDCITRHAAAEAKLQHTIERAESRRESVGELTLATQVHQASRAEAETESLRLAESIATGKAKITALEKARASIDEQLATASAGLHKSQSEVMTISVEAARLEQRVEALSTAADVVRKDQSQRETAEREAESAIARGRNRIAEIVGRLAEADEMLLTIAAAIVEADQEMKRHAAAADAQRKANKSLHIRSQEAIQNAVTAGESVIRFAAARDAAILRQTTLAERIAEDYEIDLRHDEPPENLEPIDDRDAVEAEIVDLRSQVQSVGSVNMEALEELNELQVRYDELHGQYQDLSAAKDSLQRVITRINADSRRLFLDTLEAIRLNFQKLYRKSFGGGHADLILEESDDPLEAGVEIVATPPGKPSFNNSLLSGGEKALTAVALLMAIFQYRPSPFCVLDEVDAPFDEANIGRFVMVLKEFLDSSKFVVVTHSKKTMTAANTLYGVTMQESGVSKQVSIKFEDVSEDGQINAA